MPLSLHMSNDLMGLMLASANQLYTASGNSVTAPSAPATRATSATMPSTPANGDDDSDDGDDSGRAEADETGPSPARPGR